MKEYQEALFGFHPSLPDLSVGEIYIEKLKEFDDNILLVNGYDRRMGDWIYAPQSQTYLMGHGIVTNPYPSRVFSLPKTHKIFNPHAENSEHLRFTIWVLSFFSGLRLTTTEAGFVDATPIKAGKLVDFVLIDSNYANAIDISEKFREANSHISKRLRLVEAIIHSLFLGQNPLQLQFESFLTLYYALDACFALENTYSPLQSKIGHGRRISFMCEKYGIEIPEWAQFISTLRNSASHEAIFMDEPLGFALHGIGSSQDLILEMKAMICRLLVALLNVKDETYICSSLNTRQIQGLKLGL
ncbi:MAG: hypothetical protein J0L55_13555 [Caulobacterales bacterium]|nr:hypothetical protein [Caulobacterales bacterium]MCA0372215.1 hypothetical protein [Pseudomonadota bacterium]